jgi:hypothetical protein
MRQFLLPTRDQTPAFCQKLPGWMLAFLLLSGAVARAADSSVPAQAAAPPRPQWDRVVMIGASVTDGYSANETNYAKYRLSRYVDAALLAPHEPVRNLGHYLFFFGPEAAGAQQVAAALQARPTAVVAVDFLFWFCYGTGNSDAERAKQFEAGLKLLEPISCPLVVGDIPDASAAVGNMLTPQQMPSKAALAAANRRLKAWAAGRSNVVTVALSDFMRQATSNQKIIIQGHTWKAGETRSLLQDDMLHASASGCAALTVALFQAAYGLPPGGSSAAPKSPPLPGEVQWNPDEILRLALAGPATTAPARH